MELKFKASNIMEIVCAMGRRREQLVDAVMLKLFVIETMKFDTVWVIGGQDFTIIHQGAQIVNPIFFEFSVKYNPLVDHLSIKFDKS